MKQVGYVHLEIEQDEKTFAFEMPMGVSLAQASDAAFKVFKAVDQMYRDGVDKELKEQEKKSDSTKPNEAK